MPCRVAPYLSILLLFLLAVLSPMGCGGGGATPPLEPAEPRAEALHTFGSALAHLITDVAYEVDTQSSWPVAYVRALIETAAGKADDLNDPFEHPDNAELRYQRFHFWPNVFNLTAIHQADPSLYAMILDQLLVREPLAGVRVDGDMQVARGDRVFLARDFLNAVRHGQETFHEVHFAVLINLDTRTVVQVHVHRFPLDRLPRLHDPRIDDLVAAFLAPPGVPGLAWDLCLRGNIQRIYREAVLVDFLQDDRFHITRMAPCGGNVRSPQLTRGLIPWIPRCPPKEPTPPTPGDDPPPTLIPDPPPVLQPPGGTFTKPPIRPWPFPAPRPPVFPPEEGDDSEGEPPAPSSGCSAEVPAIAALKGSLEAAWQAGRDAWDQDNETLKDFRWRWPHGRTFQDPMLQAAYEACSMEVQAFEAERDGYKADTEAAYDAWVAEDAKKPVVVDTIPWTNSLWDQLLTLGGFWSRVRAECLVTVVFPDNTVIPVTAKEQTDVQRWIAYALMNGATWDEAVDEALANDAAERLRQGFTPGENLIFREAWSQYADCLKELQRSALELFIPALEGLEGATDDEVDRIIEYMFERDDSILTPEEAQAKEECAEAIAALQILLAALREQQAEVEAELEDKRLAFTAAARDGSMAERIESLNRMLHRTWILCAFPIWCEDPDDPEAYPVRGSYFCSELRALQTDPQYTGFPEFQAYVQMLLDFNCGS